MGQKHALVWIHGLGGGGRFHLPRDLIQHLNQQDIRVIAHIADQGNSTIFAQGWKSAQQLNIPPHWHQLWQSYILALSESHIRIKEGPDELMWTLVENGIYTPKAGYLGLITNRQLEQIHDWWQSIWKLNSPPRTKLFFWRVLSNEVPTGESLCHQGLHGPHWCVLCKKSSESTEHLFLNCESLTNLWQNISSTIHLAGRWEGENINHA